MVCYVDKGQHTLGKIVAVGSSWWHNVAHEYTSSFVARFPATMTCHALRDPVKASLSCVHTLGKMVYRYSSKRKPAAVASAVIIAIMIRRWQKIGMRGSDSGS